jgi:hypothetical protein
VVHKEWKNNRVVAVHGTVVLGDYRTADAAREASVCSRTNKCDIRFGPATAITRLYQGPTNEG